MPINGILILGVLVIILGILPIWPYAKKWGYYPSGWLGLSLAIFIGLLLCGVF